MVVPSLMAKKKLDKSRKEHDALRLEASEFVLEKVKILLHNYDVVALILRTILPCLSLHSH